MRPARQANSMPRQSVWGATRGVGRGEPQRAACPAGKLHAIAQSVEVGWGKGGGGGVCVWWWGGEGGLFGMVAPHPAPAGACWPPARAPGQPAPPHTPCAAVPAAPAGGGRQGRAAMAETVRETGDRWAAPMVALSSGFAEWQQAGGKPPGGTVAPPQSPLPPGAEPRRRGAAVQGSQPHGPPGPPPPPKKKTKKEEKRIKSEKGK